MDIFNIYYLLKHLLHLDICHIHTRYYLPIPFDCLQLLWGRSFVNQHHDYDRHYPDSCAYSNLWRHYSKHYICVMDISDLYLDR